MLIYFSTEEHLISKLYTDELNFFKLRLKANSRDKICCVVILEPVVQN